MSKWGLLRGAGQGIAQAGTMLMGDKLDKMKEERLQAYQQKLQSQQFEREDKLRKEDQGIDTQKASIEQANRLLDRDDRLAREGQAQDNFELTFGQSKALVDRQITQINQEIDMTKLDLEQRTELNGLWNKIREAPDPETRDALYEQYRVLTGTDKDDRFSAVTLYGEENEQGIQTRQSGVLNSRTGQITPALPGSAESARPSLEELITTPGSQTGAPGSQDNPMPYQQGEGLLIRPSASELSQELGVTVNPGVTERIGGAIQNVGQNMRETTTTQYVQWVKGMIENDSVDQVNFANRHAYRAALESGQLSDQESRIVRRLLGQQ